MTGRRPRAAGLRERDVRARPLRGGASPSGLRPPPPTCRGARRTPPVDILRLLSPPSLTDPSPPPRDVHGRVDHGGRAPPPPPTRLLSNLFSAPLHAASFLPGSPVARGRGGTSRAASSAPRARPPPTDIYPLSSPRSVLHPARPPHDEVVDDGLPPHHPPITAALRSPAGGHHRQQKSLRRSTERREMSRTPQSRCRPAAPARETPYLHTRAHPRDPVAHALRPPSLLYPLSRAHALSVPRSPSAPLGRARLMTAVSPGASAALAVLKRMTMSPMSVQFSTTTGRAAPTPPTTGWSDR